MHSARSAILIEIGRNIYKSVKEEEKNGLYMVLLAIWREYEEPGRVKIVLSGESDNVCLFEQGDGCT
jgi:hypothetical protein